MILRCNPARRWRPSMHCRTFRSARAWCWCCSRIRWRRSCRSCQSRRCRQRRHTSRLHRTVTRWQAHRCCRKLHSDLHRSRCSRTSSSRLLHKSSWASGSQVDTRPKRTFGSRGTRCRSSRSWQRRSSYSRMQRHTDWYPRCSCTGPLGMCARADIVFRTRRSSCCLIEGPCSRPSRTPSFPLDRRRCRAGHSAHRVRLGHQHSERPRRSGYRPRLARQPLGRHAESEHPAAQQSYTKS